MFLKNNQKQNATWKASTLFAMVKMHSGIHQMIHEVSSSGHHLFLPTLFKGLDKCLFWEKTNCLKDTPDVLCFQENVGWVVSHPINKFGLESTGDKEVDTLPDLPNPG